MIEIYINPLRVERILFNPRSDMEEDFDLAAWKAIRPLVDQIDDRLRQISRELSQSSSSENIHVEKRGMNHAQEN